MMPPPSSKVKAAAPDAEIADEKILEHLRTLRAEVQDLKDVLDDIRKGQATPEAYSEYIQTTKDDIAALMAAIHDGDTVAHLRNLWEQMQVCPLLIRPSSTFQPQEQLHYLDILDRQIRKMIYLIGSVTIPSRLNKWLDEARPGYYVPFHLVFDDEIPDQDDRSRVLYFLSWAPKAIKGGLVDPVSGLIYRYDTDPWKRRLSLLWLVLAFLAAIGIVAGSAVLPVQGWMLAPGNLSLLLIGWLALLIGVIVHVAVGSRKRTQGQTDLPPTLAVSDIGLLIDARLGQILMKLLMALIGFFGLVLSSGIANVTLLNCFLVGYSLDSVVELFGTSLQQQATVQVESLKKQLNVQ